MPKIDFGEGPQDSNDLFMDDLKNPSLVLPNFNDHDYTAPNVSYPGDVNPTETSVPHLCVETNGETKLFPLVFLSSAADFIDECIEVEPYT